MRWQPGMNLSGLLNACNEMLAEPLPFEWSNQTPRFLLIFTGLYAVIALAASSEHRNTRPGEEHGSARWGNAKELNRRYRDTQGPNLLMTRNIRIGVDTQNGDYLIPNIVIRKTKPLGHYGRLRKAYLEMHRPILFNELVLSDKLFEHCAEIDEAARNRMELIVRSLAKQYGVTEQLKAENQMEWVRQMNACKAQAEEIVKAELIYD